MIGKLEKVRLKDVWENDAYDLSKWLQENLDVLEDSTGLKFSSATCEQFAGSLSVLLVAKEASGKTFVVENQVDESDDAHLGKLVTHLSHFGAQGAIWIVSEPKVEHVRAVNWLNQSSTGAFYIVRLEAVRIGKSAPAPIFSLHSGPEIGSGKVEAIPEAYEDSPEDQANRRLFWGELIETAGTWLPMFADAKPTDDQYMGARPYRNTAFQYQFWIYPESTVVQLRIDDGNPNSKFNERVFEYLIENREQIEGAFRSPLEWGRLDGRHSCCISKRIRSGGYRDPQSKWKAIQTEMIHNMAQLEGTLQPYLVKASPVAVR